MEESAAFFRQVVESSPDGIWAVDLHGRTLHANRRAAELLGRGPEEMADLTVYDVLDPRGRVQFDAHLERTRCSGPERHEVECTYVRADGSYVTLILNEGGLTDESGDLVGLVHRMTDDEERRVLTSQVRRSRERLHEAQAMGRIGSWELDLASGDLDCSAQMFRLFDADPAGGATIRELFAAHVSPEGAETVRGATQAALDTGEDQDFDISVTFSDGTEGWYHGHVRASEDEKGQRTRLGGTLQDLSELKRTEADLLDAVRLNAMLHVLLTSANAATTLADALRTMRTHLLTHEDWTRAVGFQVDGACGDAEDGRDPRLVPYLASGPDFEPNAVEWHLAREALSAGRVVFDEDSRPEAPSVGFPITLDGGPLVVVVITTASPFRRRPMVQSMVEQLADQLARVATRERVAQELAAARDEAMEASRLKSSFLATMSHEIRTPMNGVIGLNELLLRTSLAPDQQRLARGVQQAGRTLLQLINDILDSSKIEAGELELESVDFDLRGVVEHSVALVRSTADEKGLDLRVAVSEDVPTTVRSDPTRLSQVLTNLLSNAVKFTAAGSVDLQISTLAGAPDHTALRFEVADTGIGISQEQRDRLFEPFRQADASTTRTHGGTGLGLAIARQLVHALGGEIGMTSSPGAGSTFWFTATLDRAQPAPERAAPHSPARRSAGAPPRGRVLVVEDNEINQLVALGLVEALGYTCAVAGSGAAAVQMISREHFDAVLMDLQMPGMDGFTAAAELRRAESGGRRAPIIAMTASAVTGERDRCLAAGMDGFLSKPVNGDELAALLREQVRHAAPTGPEQTETAPSSGTPALDPARLEELLAMGPRAVPVVERAMSNFVTGLPEAVDEIGGAVAKADSPLLRQLAHRLKGSALNLGASLVAQVAAELEALGDAGQAQAAGPTLARLEAAVSDTCAALAAYREHRLPQEKDPQQAQP